MGKDALIAEWDRLVESGHIECPMMTADENDSAFVEVTSEMVRAGITDTDVHAWLLRAPSYDAMDQRLAPRWVVLDAVTSWLGLRELLKTMPGWIDAVKAYAARGVMRPMSIIAQADAYRFIRERFREFR
jgi:hypothetical protein